MPTRPRSFAFPALRPDARRRLSVGLQRCRNGDALRGDRTARARRGRTRLDRRRALRTARADRCRGGRCRRAALLALQVLRAAPRPRVRPQAARRELAPLQGAARAATSRSRGASRRARSRTSSWRASSPPSSTWRTSAGTSSRSTSARWANVSSTGYPIAGVLHGVADDGRPGSRRSRSITGIAPRGRRDPTRRAWLRRVGRQLLRRRDHEPPRPAGRGRSHRHRPLQHRGRGRPAARRAVPLGPDLRGRRCRERLAAKRPWRGDPSRIQAPRSAIRRPAGRCGRRHPRAARRPAGPSSSSSA